MEIRRLGAAAIVLAVLAITPQAKAVPVTNGISFTDFGTYQVSGAGFYNGDSFATASFTITFDPTQLYLTQSIAGFITGLTYSVTDDRFSATPLILNPITEFAFDGAGTLTLYSNSTLNKTLNNTANITIGINGWAYPPASSVWYSQPEFNDTLTTSGGVTIHALAAPAETPLPAAVWLLGSVLAGGAGFGRWRKRKAKVGA
jgi:hypothetical protein